MSPYLLIILGLGALMLFGAGIGLLAGGGSSVDERLEEFVGSPTALAMPEAPSVSRRKEEPATDSITSSPVVVLGPKSVTAFPAPMSNCTSTNTFCCKLASASAWDS